MFDSFRQKIKWATLSFGLVEGLKQSFPNVSEQSEAAVKIFSGLEEWFKISIIQS